MIVSPSAQAAGSSSSGLSASVVAGAVIGVMFALVALTLLYIYVRKNNQKRKATISGGFDSVTEGTDQQFSPFTCVSFRHPTEKVVTPHPPPPPSTHPLLSFLQGQ